MPMRPELYPDQWNEIAHFVKECCDWTCQVCDKQCRRPGEPFDTHRRTLTVAHWDHDYDSVHTFVVACCASCHLTHDRWYHVASRRRWARLRQLAAGQLSLFGRALKETVDC